MRAATVIVALAVAGCAAPATPVVIERAERAEAEGELVQRGDSLAAGGDLEGALRAYDLALARGANGGAAIRARAGRTAVVAALEARGEVVRVRQELERVRGELARRDAEIARLTEEAATREREAARLGRDLTARDGEVAKLRTDLAAREAEAEQLRADIEDLKRIEMRLERRR